MRGTICSASAVDRCRALVAEEHKAKMDARRGFRAAMVIAELHAELWAASIRPFIQSADDYRAAARLTIPNRGHSAVR
jgi:hypothetical protein